MKLTSPSQEMLGDADVTSPLPPSPPQPTASDYHVPSPVLSFEDALAAYGQVLALAAEEDPAHREWYTSIYRDGVQRLRGSLLARRPSPRAILQEVYGEVWRAPNARKVARNTLVNTDRHHQQDNAPPALSPAPSTALSTALATGAETGDPPPPPQLGDESASSSPSSSTLGGAAQRWGPWDYHFYEKQWRTQRGAWGDPEGVSSKLSEDVAAVISTFRTKGTDAALEDAKQRGLLDGAKEYLWVRGYNEEELASRLAATRVRLAKRPQLPDKLKEAFLQARLEEVRTAVSKGHTPDQAVIDKPEVARRTLPRWLIYGSLGLSAFSFLLSLSSMWANRGRGRRPAPRRDEEEEEEEES